jgi:recombination protein RecA
MSSNIEDLWNEMIKQYGEDGFVREGRVFMPNVETITSGSPVVDDILGVGGLPCGRIVQYAGCESSGKTLMSLMAIREWQKLNPKNWAFFIDAEYTLDLSWASQLGVDTGANRLIVYKENDGAKIFSRLCGVPHKEAGKPKTKLGLLDLVATKGGYKESGLGLIVLDSIAAVAPPMELASVSGKNNMALMGRFLPPELRKITPLLSNTGVVFIAINQVRTDPGKMWGDPTTTTGGSAWKHYCSLMLHFLPIGAADTKIIEDGVQVGHRVKARVDKNKCGSPYRIGEFDIKYTEGLTNRHVEAGELAIKYGVVKRPSKVMYEYGEQRTRGKDNFYEFVKESGITEELIQKASEARVSGAKTAEEPTTEEEEE